MKKIILGLFLWLTLINNCFARDFNKLELIPVGESANVSGEVFDYKDMVYSSSNDSYYVSFSSVFNKSSEKVPVSINLLLFDSNQTNIGLLAYCSSYDYDSDYSSVKIGSKGSSPLSIKVLPKYFVTGKSGVDVSYIAVLDDNPYCQVGDSDKYATLKIEDISEGLSASEVIDKSFEYGFDAEFENNFLAIFLSFILIVLVVYVLDGMIMNILNEKMYGTTDINVYVPVIRNYIKLKLAFNEIIAAIGMFIYYTAFMIAFVTGIRIFWTLSSLIFVVATIRIIAKIFLYKKNNNINIDTNTTNINNSDNSDNTSTNEEVDKEESVSSDNMIENNNQNNSNNSVNNNQESDLSKLFK